MKIVVVDYKTGNQQSVLNALKKIKVPAIISADPEDLLSADKIILPGVGHFSTAMKALHQRNLMQPLQQAAENDIPLLGICLGMQLLGDSSEEAPGVAGLGLIKGKVKRMAINDQLRYKLPHINWAKAKNFQHNPLCQNQEEEQEFYFVHAYHFIPDSSENILCTSIYETEFVSAIMKKKLFGVQFHPEKSHIHGINLLQNFVHL